MSTHQSDALYSSFSQIHRAIVQYSSTATGEIQVIIPSVTGNDTTVPISFFGRKEHPFENDWVVPNIGDTIIVCREDEDYTNTFWINTTYNPVRADVGEANPTSYHFGPHGSTTGAFTLIDYAATPASSGLFMGSVNMGYYNATASEWRTYMDYNGNFYLRGSGTNALTWNGSTLAVSGAITASTIEIGANDTILKVDTAGNLSIGHDTPSSAPFQVSNAGAVIASNLTITGGEITGLNSTGISINGGVFAVTSAGALTATNATITGAITATSGTFTGTVNANAGAFSGTINATGTISGGTITGAAITAGTINVPASNPKFSVAATGVITAVDGIFSGALSAGTITGDWEITTGELKIAATTDTSTMLTLKNDGTNAMLVADVAGQSLPGYVLINKASDHSNLQLLAPAMTGSTRPGMTIKHYTGGGSYVNIGTDDSDPQILLQDTGTGTATITSTDINLNASGVLYLRAPQISLATANTDHVFVDYNGIYFGDDQPAATAHRLYRNGNDLHWNGSAVGGSSGTVTSVATSGAITGGTITTSGTISHSTAAGYNHVPAGGSSGQVLKYSSAGTAAWGTDNDTTYSAGTGMSLSGTTFNCTVTDTNTTYSAGNGIFLSGTTFSLSDTPVITGAIKLNSGTTSAPAYSFSGTGADVAGIAHVSIFGVHATYLASDGNHFAVYSNGGVNMTDPGTGSGNTLYYDGGNVKRSSSQEILKENITTIPSSAALARIKALRPVEYNMKPELFDGDEAEWQVYHKKRGFIAEEVSAVDHWMAQHWWLDPTDAKRLRSSPKSYSATEDTDPSNYDMADTDPIDWNDRAVITDAVAAIQELSTKLDAAEARIATLESA